MVGDVGMVTEEEGMLFVLSLDGGAKAEAHATTTTIFTTSQTKIPTVMIMSHQSDYCGMCGGGDGGGVFGSKFLSKLLSGLR